MRNLGCFGQHVLLDILVRAPKTCIRVIGCNFFFFFFFRGVSSFNTLKTPTLGFFVVCLVRGCFRNLQRRVRVLHAIEASLAISAAALRLLSFDLAASRRLLSLNVILTGWSRQFSTYVISMLELTSCNDDVIIPSLLTSL